MRSKQLIGDQFDNDQLMLNQHQANMWTALPGIILSFDPVEMTCSVQPAIQSKMFKGTTSTNKNLPVLVDCPVVFPRGGNCTITFPIKKGDECLIVFSSRCIDGWWQLGGFQDDTAVPRPQLENRMHDLSDAIIIPGPFSQTQVLENVNIDAVEIRSNDGATKINLNPTNNVINIITPTTLNINAPSINITGDIELTGKLTASDEITAIGTHLHTHTHGSVQPGSGSTGVPN